MTKKLFDLTGKTAIITGGASGIGLSISKLFVEQGADVAIIDLNEQVGIKVVEELQKINGKAVFHSCNISDQKQVLKTFNQIHQQSGSVDILVNNAGIAHVGNIEHTSEEDLDRLYQVNVKGAYNCSLAAIKIMKEAHAGCIVNISSIVSFLGVADRFAYTVTKGAVHTMTYSIAKDYIDFGIRCNSIAPARVHTPFVDGFLAKNYPGNESEMFEKLSKTQPIGRMGKPQEIAHLALYLCSDEASFITGSCYNIDGGFTTLNS